MSSRGINKVMLIGNLGRDPDVRYTASGDQVSTCSIATSESWKDRETGELKEKTEWHRVVFFGKLAVVVAEWIKKGSKIYVEGRLQTRSWEKDGEKKYTTEVVVDQRGTLQMLGDVGQGGSRPASGKSKTQAPAVDMQAPAKDQAQAGGFDDDIPF